MTLADGQRAGGGQILFAIAAALAIGWLLPQAIDVTGGEWIIAGGVLVLAAGLVLPARFPESLLIATLAATLLLNDQGAFAIGFPSIGINVVDLLVLSFVPWSLARSFASGRVRDQLSRDRVLLLLLLLLVVGSFFLMVGLQRGAWLRTALRDYRFFVYLPITYVYAALACRHARCWRNLLVAWYLISAVQFLAIGTGLLVLHGDLDKEVALFSSTAGTSIWHFVQASSYLPFFVSLSHLLHHSRITKLELSVHGAIVAVLSLLVAVSFSRGLWITVALSTLLLALMVRGRRLASAARLAVTATVAGGVLVGALIWFKATETLVQLAARAISSGDQTDLAIVTRIADLRWTLGEILRNPLGHGLGMGDLSAFFIGDEQLGGALHMGYVWLAFRGGVLATVLFVAALWYGLRDATRTMRAMDSGSERHVIWLRGVAAALIALSLSALYGTAMAYFMVIPYFGVLLGMLSLVRPATPPALDRGILTPRPSGVT